MSFYRYIAAELILGKLSPYAKELHHFGLGPFSALYKNIVVTEDIILDENSKKLDKIKTLQFKDGTILEASHTSAINDISKIITYKNDTENLYISDVIFKEEDFKFSEYFFSRLIKATIYKTSILIQALNEKYIDDVPLIMNDFSNIVEVLYATPGIF
jgi:hypothetical protein